MTSPRTPMDALRYGLRALEEMSRAQASVIAPPRSQSPVFAPHPFVRPPSREGSALSLRMFSDAADDATEFVLRQTDTLTFSEIPARATHFFESYASEMAYSEEGDEFVVGFPLVSYLEGGARRTAPLLFWSGARASWRVGDLPWRLPHRARVGSPLLPPTSLVLRAPPTEPDEPAFGLHAGLWRQLLDLDGPALAALAQAGAANVAALVRAATSTLTHGAEEPFEGPVDAAPLTRDDVQSLVDAVHARSASRLSLQAHPHALAMLLPRGDPTSGLRTELRALLRGAAPREGPLAVLLGARAREPARGPLWTHFTSTPTASQVDAAAAFEGTRDLVALCGPPGCGKTTLIHHLAAQSVVDRALGDLWVRPPPESAPWAMVVTSTNNAAVDHALAPFLHARALPVGVRFGNRKTLGEATAQTLHEALAALASTEGPTLAQARAAFESVARPARAHQRELKARSGERAKKLSKLNELYAYRDALTEQLEAPLVEVDASVSAGEVRTVRESLEAHAKASTLVVPLVIDGTAASRKRARARWARANALRGKVIRPVLQRLAIEVPFRDLLPDDDVGAALDAQRDAMCEVVGALEAIERSLRAPQRRGELKTVLAALEIAERDREETPAPPPDPALVEAALEVRDAWCRTHRDTFRPRIDEVLSLVDDGRRSERGRGLSAAIAGLAAMFPVAGCTLLSMRASFDLEPGVIDRLVIDEAGQCAPIYTVAALARATRALITGDIAQLPPVYTLDDRLDARLARGLEESASGPFRMGASSTTSAQSVAELRAAAPRSLIEHFRSQPEIVALASTWSGYTLDVRTPPRSLGGLSRWLAGPVRVFDVRGRGHRAPEGVVNEAEAARVVEMVAALVRDGVEPSDIAVLTPFVGQSTRIERDLARRGLAHDRGVLVRTVHKLQGGERRVVVFSVAATEPKHLRWLASRPHLLHVATSRAQDHLLVFLDAAHARSEVLLRPLVDAARGVSGARRPGAL